MWEVEKEESSGGGGKETGYVCRSELVYSFEVP